MNARFKYLSLPFFLIILFQSVSFGQAQKTYPQIFSLGAIEEIEFLIEEAKASIEFRKTKGSRLIIETNITLQNVEHPRLLDIIAAQGRYTLSEEKKDEKIFIKASPKRDILIVKGEEVQEAILYIIYVPPHIKLVKTSPKIL